MEQQPEDVPPATPSKKTSLKRRGRTSSNADLPPLPVPAEEPTRPAPPSPEKRRRPAVLPLEEPPANNGHAEAAPVVPESTPPPPPPLTVYTFASTTTEPRLVLTSVAPSRFAALKQMRDALIGSNIDPSVIAVQRIESLSEGTRLWTLSGPK